MKFFTSFFCINLVQILFILLNSKKIKEKILKIIKKELMPMKLDGISQIYELTILHNKN